MRQDQICPFALRWVLEIPVRPPAPDGAQIRSNQTGAAKVRSVEVRAQQIGSAHVRQSQVCAD